MTTPVAHDYPDWGRQAAAADIIVVQHVNEVFAAAIIDGPRFVGQYPYVHVRGGANVPNLQIHLQWYLDVAGAQFIGDDWAQVNAGQELIVTFPVRAPFLKVTSQLSAYPNTATSVVTMSPAPATGYAGFAGDNALISVANGGPLGGGANVTITAAAVRAGPAYFEADVLGATAFTVYLQAIDAFIGNVFLASFYAAKRATRINLHLPPLPCQVQVFNQDAAAHDYRVFLVHQNTPI